MSKSPRNLWVWFLAALPITVVLTSKTAYAGGPPNSASSSNFTNASVIRAQNNLTRIKSLVEQGVLPRKNLLDAEAVLADAEDEQILSNTLYGGIRAQNISPDEAKQMLDAAARRVDRQQSLVDDRTKLIASGTLARGEIQPLAGELEMRKRALELTRERAQLVQQLVAMANAEQAMERAGGARPVMMRYDGTTPFSIAGLPAIGAAFAKQFHEDLPVSALGQTSIHQELGFDHRGRVDVALNPDSQQGLWLRSFLERRHIPYIAFRAAVTGSATAPHIHIGPGSMRVKVAPPPDTIGVTQLGMHVEKARTGGVAHGS